MPRTTTTASAAPTAPARTSSDDAPNVDDPRRYDALQAAMAAFKANGEIGSAMIARLHQMLDRMEMLPIEDWIPWQAGVSRYIRLRRGPLPRPLPPNAWGWKFSLAHGIVLAWGLAGEAFGCYRKLSKGQKARAVEEFGGRFVDENGNPGPLLRLGWPVESVHSLDYRAAMLHIDVRAREMLTQREQRAVKWAKRKAGH